MKCMATICAVEKQNIHALISKELWGGAGGGAMEIMVGGDGV